MLDPAVPPAASSSTSAATGAARGSVILVAAFVAVGTGNYAFTLVVARLLSLPDYGVVGLVQGFILSAAWLTQAGFPMTAARRLSQDADPAARGAVLRGAILGNLAIAVVLGTVLLALLAAGVLELNQESGAPLVIAAVACSFMGVGQAAKGALQGLFRFGVVGIASLLETGLKLIVGLALVAIGLGPTGAAVGILVGLLASTAFTLAALGDVPLRRGRGFGGLRLVAESLPMFAGFAGIALLTTVDVFVLKVLDTGSRSNLDVGLYSGAVVIARLPVFCAAAMQAAVFPHIARSGSDQERARLFLRKGVLYILALLTPLSLAMMVAPQTVIGVFLKGDFSPAASALRILAVGTIAISVADFVLGALLARSLRWAPPVVTLAVVAPELLLLVVGVRVASAHGTSAALAATALAFDVAAAASALSLCALAMRRFHWRPRWHGVAAYLAASAGFCAVLAALPHSGLIGLALSGAVAAVAYAVIALVGGLVSRGDLATLWTALPRRRVRPSATG